MDDPKKDKTNSEAAEAPSPIQVDPPISTDEEGKKVDLPDLGGKID